MSFMSNYKPQEFAEMIGDDIAKELQNGDKSNS